MARPVGWYRLPKSGIPFYGPVPDGVDFGDAPPVVEQPARPTRSAAKAKWVEWAVLNGWSPEDAEKKTKDQLIDELGSAVLEQQLVDPGNSGPEVGADVLVDQQLTQTDELVTPPVDGLTGEDDLNGGQQVPGHEAGS